MHYNNNEVRGFDKDHGLLGHIIAEYLTVVAKEASRIGIWNIIALNLQFCDFHFIYRPVCNTGKR